MQFADVARMQAWPHIQHLILRASIPSTPLLFDSYLCIFRSCSWLGLINVHKFPLDNFHLQYLSTIIQTSEMTFFVK
jgi:hypothetical protein